MSIESVDSLTAESQQQMALTHSACETTGELRIIPINPEDVFEHILLVLRSQAKPAILLLPEQGQALSDPSHFAHLRQVSTPDQVCLVIPPGRMRTAARYAHHYGFLFASSLEKAAHLFPAREEASGSSNLAASMVSPQPTTSMAPVPEEKDTGAEGFDAQATAPPSWSFPATPSLPEHASLISARQRRAIRRFSLLGTMLALLLVAGMVLLPALFSMSPGFMSTAAPAVSLVGSVAFLSSGQLDASNTTGLNDMIRVSLHNLSTPVVGQSYYGWLLPDKADDETQPLLLGRLTIVEGKASMTYIHPDHANLLAIYSGFQVTEQPNNETPTAPSLDPTALRYAGFIPTTPTPGDEQHFSLLDHLRHLLAKDPTLRQVGLSGGLDIWLSRNAEKILEWSSAARDDQRPGAINALRQQLIRTLEYLDGVAYVFDAGDLPPMAPLLVDPLSGRIGLLELHPMQTLPGYLAHVETHLQGLSNAPGHTQMQQALAIRLDRALKTDTSLLQKVRQDAITLVRMTTAQLQSPAALALLDEMVTNANAAYTGQFDPTTGGNINGITWIHTELQEIATIPVAVANDKGK